MSYYHFLLLANYYSQLVCFFLNLHVNISKLTMLKQYAKTINEISAIALDIAIAKKSVRIIAKIG